MDSPTRCPMPDPKQPLDPHATMKMIPSAMFETKEFSAEQLVEQMEARRKEAAETAQADSIQPPPSTSSPE